MPSSEESENSEANSSIESLDADKNYDLNQTLRPKYISAPYKPNKESEVLKKYIMALDILTVLLVIISTILILVEHEYYYYDNLVPRVISVVIINYINNINKSSTNITHSIDTIFKNINLVQLTDYTGESGISKNYLLNTKNFTNQDVLNSFNISKTNYKENITNADNIVFNLVVSDFNNTMRTVILLITILSCNLNFYFRYFDMYFKIY